MHYNIYDTYYKQCITLFMIYITNDALQYSRYKLQTMHYTIYDTYYKQCSTIFTTYITKNALKYSFLVTANYKILHNSQYFTNNALQYIL